MAVNAKHGVRDLLDFCKLAEVNVFLNLHEDVLEAVIDLDAIDDSVLEIFDGSDCLSFDSLGSKGREGNEVVVVGNRFSFAGEFESSSLFCGFDKIDAAFLSSLVCALCSNSSTLLAEASEFDSKSEELAGFIRTHDRIFAVAQTTSRPANYDFLLKKVRKAVGAMPGHRFLAAETICTATLKRQDSAGELAKRVAAMVVVGGKNSSNTSKLFQVVSERNKNSFWVESPENFSASDIETLKNSESVGITAGASTPDEQIDEMKSFLESLND